MASLSLPLEGLLLRGQDLLLVILLLVVFFGAKKIPELAKGLGEGIRNFKTSIKEEPKPSEEPKKEEEKQRV
jgi:sec-independent protein translocase protein TatA